MHFLYKRAVPGLVITQYYYSTLCHIVSMSGLSNESAFNSCIN